MRLVFSACAIGLGAQDPRTLRPQQAAVQPGAPEARTALVIGNGAYRMSPLKNPVQDAKAMAETLQKCGFRVTLLEDATRMRMVEALRMFGQTIQGGGVGLFYFAGHGLQVKGKNYLVPVDSDLASEDEVAYSTLDADAVLAKMETARNRLNILILDACRNNPFGSNARGFSQGLAQMDAPAGSYIAFATAPGRTAADGSGSHGLYTQYLLAQMAQPGLRLEDVFKHVRAGVMRDSKAQQVPWESSSITGDFYFMPTGTPLPSGHEEMVAIASDQVSLLPQVLAADAPSEVRGTEGRIVFFRKSHWLLGTAATYEIEMSGKLLGKLRPGEYFNVKVPCGKLKFSVTVEQFSKRSEPTIHHVKVKPGEPVYVHCDMGVEFVPKQDALRVITKLKNIGDEGSD